MSKYLMIIAALTVVICGCKKELSQAEADFTVSADKNTITLGDTVRFSFSGNPDVITFYSGLAGKRYEYRERTSAEGTSQLSFRTARLTGGTQPNSLALMISQDFPGVIFNDIPGTLQRITAAGWTDITARATLATGPTAVPSGNIDLTDYAAQNRYVYLAFKYTGLAGSTQNRWFIDLFSLKNLLADGTSYEIANHNFANVGFTNYGVTTYTPGFVGYAMENTFNWTFNASSLAINGASSAQAAANRSEAWAIMGPIDLKKVTPDVGEPVKSVAQKTSTIKYTYKYPQKGTFNATFSGGSVSIEASKYSSKKIEITVN